MKIRLLWLAILSAISLHIQAQNYRIHGTVIDPMGAPLEYVKIGIPASSYFTSSDVYGRFELVLPDTTQASIYFTLLGYSSVQKKFDANDTSFVRITMYVSDKELNEIRVRYEKDRHLPVVNLSPKIASTLPGAISGGIEGLIKTLPGVSSAGELSSQYSVRGGNYDENLVYIHGIEIPKSILIRSGQQEGLSIINPDLTGLVSFSAGGFDASYGDKISSVLSIEYKKPSEFAGNAYGGLLGAGVSAMSPVGKNNYLLAGLRYKQSKYLLGSLETNGEYQPNFMDAQIFYHHQLSSKSNFDFFTYAARNRYVFIPTNRQTEFGTASQPLKISTYFDGKEDDLYTTTLSALIYTYKPVENSTFSLGTSYYRANESETFDILAQYWLNELNKQLDSPEYGDSLLNIGIGSTLEHARNYLLSSRIQSNLTYEFLSYNSRLQAGLGIVNQQFESQLAQWTLLDSTGYSLPYTTTDFELWHAYNGNITIQNSILTAYTVYTRFLNSQHGKVSLNAGGRFNHFTLNGKTYFSPRFNISYQPAKELDILYRISGGNYLQFPEFKEFTNAGNMNLSDIAIQDSWQIMAGTDINFNIWNRPFKATAELYYKWLKQIIPYQADNIKISYFPQWQANGYTAGIDVKVNGEFVPDAESWLGFSLMRSREHVQGAKDTWRFRPNDQLFLVNIYFQDYFPGMDKMRFFVNMTYGTGVPISAPNEIETGPIFRTIPYRRVDLGINSRIGFLENKLQIIRKSHNQGVYLWFEVLNLLDILNTASYQWVRIVPNQTASGIEYNTMQFAIPNRLTGRLFNLRLQISF